MSLFERHQNTDEETDQPGAASPLGARDVDRAETADNDAAAVRPANQTGLDKPVSSSPRVPAADEPVAADPLGSRSLDDATPSGPSAEPTGARADDERFETSPVDGARPIATGRPDTARTEPIKPVVAAPPAADDLGASTYGADALGVGARTTPGADNVAGDDHVPGDDHAAGPGVQSGAWRQVLSEFVDNPRDAVEQADRLVDDAVRSLTERIHREHTGLRDAWHTHGEPSTEELRKALRGYRDFFDKVLNSR